MRILIDTNCLLAATPRRSQYRWLYDAVLNGQVELVVTTEILAEYEEQLGKFYAPDYADYVLLTLVNLPNLIKVNPLYFNWLLISRDPDDNKFVDAFIASGADHIITNDRHFDVLSEISFPIVSCIKLPDFQLVLLAYLSEKAE